MSLATEEEIQKWTFFCKEVAKANDTLDCIESLWSIINLRDNAYNPFFALLIDSLTTKVFLHLGHLFDSQDDSLRLTRVIKDKDVVAKVKDIELEAKPFIEARHKEHAHINKVDGAVNLESNFRLMDERNLSKVRDILSEVSTLLRQWGVRYNSGTVIHDHWGNIGNSREVFIEDLQEYNFLRNKISTTEHIEIIEEMSKINVEA